MNGTPLLELVDVRKSYGTTPAVAGVSLSLSRGEFMSLLGPSGSGKTTTLHLIAGLVKASHGTIRLDGREIGPLPPYKRNIGVVFQNYALFPHLTVARNIAFPLEMRSLGRADIQRKVADVLRLVDLPDYAARYPRELSGGQQQRVALARAIVFEPNVLLMDEPLGALDKNLREQMQLEIKRLHKRLGVTIVYVTHDQDEALILSDRIAIFNAGRIEQVGTPAELYEHPCTRFVAEFVGESNIIGAKVANSDGPVWTLQAGAAILQATATAPQQAGASVLVSIRPERIRLTKTADAAPDRTNALPGLISQVVYVGRMRKYIVNTAALGMHLSVLTQVTSAAGPAFDVGEAVTVAWEASDATILTSNT